MHKPVPASYGRASYYAEHAFKFTAADGTSRFGRYRWIPEAGVKSTASIHEHIQGDYEGPQLFALTGI
jgi:catalase